MNVPSETRQPLMGLGMASLVLGTMALILFFLPVLGIPISALGLLFGLVGFGAAFGGGARLRWSVAGIAMCVLALGVNLALYFAPEINLPVRHGPRLWRPVPDRPYVPPPA